MPEVKDQPPQTEPKAPVEVEQPKPDIPANTASAPPKESTRPPVYRDPRPAKVPVYKRPIFVIAAAIVVLVALVLGIRTYLYARAHESTDDAFVEGHIIEISSKVASHVTKVYVKDNQQVKKGDLLIELDTRDFQAKVDEARGQLTSTQGRRRAAESTVSLTKQTSSAAIQQASSGVTAAQSIVASASAQIQAARTRRDQAQASVNTARANVAQAASQVKAAQAEADRTAADVVRYQQLFGKDEVSRQRLDEAIAADKAASAAVAAANDRVVATQAQVAEAVAAVQTAEANIRQQEAQLKQSQADVGTARAKLTEASAAPQQVAVTQAQAGTAGGDVQQAEAAVEQAELNLSYTKIYASEDGRVTRKTVQEGAYVQVGQSLLAIVPDDLWVTANFKETQLDDVRPGQPVEVTVDAFPGKVFKGHVDSIQRGSGARFSLLPPENASGNYVKVVQRVPVKIVFDEPPDPKYPLGPGMSVVPEVKVK